MGGDGLVDRGQATLAWAPRGSLYVLPSAPPEHAYLGWWVVGSARCLLRRRWFAGLSGRCRAGRWVERWARVASLGVPCWRGTINGGPCPSLVGGAAW